MIIKELQKSDYRIRKLVGILGLALPFLLPISQREFFSSISHYYYQSVSSLIFIIILSTFGLFLISYKGYKIDKTTESVSDDFITNIGGFAAMIVVIIPTWCSGSESNLVDVICTTKDYPLLGHNSKLLNTIHLISAGIFILSMGWMSRFKFIRGNDENKYLYKLCGNIVFIAVVLLILCIILEKLNINFPLKDYYVFILETVAIIPFGISWLVKGKTIEDIKELKGLIISRAK